MQATKGLQAVALNDEVAAILRGLKLDKQFFLERIRPEAQEELMPLTPAASRLDLSLPGQVDLEKEQRASLRKSRKKLTLLKSQGQQRRGTDFDIYLNEAVMPVLAQALDALCRQLARMKEQGDRLDPKVRARFNPLTWLGQQLLRRHPKCAKTPRRQQLYRSFKDWADWEKGRREMLRKREVVCEVFSHFVLRGTVQHETIGAVIDAVDDTLRLEGALKTSHEVARMVEEEFPSQARSKGSPAQRKPIFVGSSGCNFEEFWYRLANVITRHDVVPYSLIVRGEERQRREAQEQGEWAKRQAAAEEEERREEAEKRRQAGEYAALHERLLADPQIRAILGDGKILTGDDVRAGDIGYEMESLPHGAHVSLLADLLVLLGFEGARRQDYAAEDAQAAVGNGGFLRATAHASHTDDCGEDERYWDEGLAGAWKQLQRVLHAEMADGVVDAEILRQVLVPPVGFIMLKAKVDYELEGRNEDGAPDDDLDLAAAAGSEVKPSMEELAQRLGMTLSRLDWLHKLFESFLQPTSTERGAPPPCCLYPECPASIDKAHFRTLVAEVEPHLSRAQFEARFKRLDLDGSGLIEFDEFAMWVHSSEVKITGDRAVKMTLEEIANRNQEPLELIAYLHSCFQDQLPDGVFDRYPSEPAGLARSEAKFLVGILTPGFDENEFETNFALVDSTARQRGYCDFDEFLEILELDDLPAELRDRFEDN